MDKNINILIEKILASGLLLEIINQDNDAFEMLLAAILQKRIEFIEKIQRDFINDMTGDISGMDTPEG